MASFNEHKKGGIKVKLKLNIKGNERFNRYKILMIEIYLSWYLTHIRFYSFVSYCATLLIIKFAGLKNPLTIIMLIINICFIHEGVDETISYSYNYSIKPCVICPLIGFLISSIFFPWQFIGAVVELWIRSKDENCLQVLQ